MLKKTDLRTRRTAWAFAIFLLGLLISCRSASAADRPPNVIVFLADDAGWGDYGINGNRLARTPNIDAIGRDGAQFEHFYVSAVCSPTRAEFLTGRYYPRGGVRGVSTGQERLNLDEKTIADAFKARSYATGAFGKWHNGSQWPYHPMARGFDEYYGYTAGHWGEYFDPPLEHNGRMVRERGYIVDLCTDRSLAFIESNRANPFFCYIPFTTPHSPWAAPEKNWQHFKEAPLVQIATNPKQEVPEQTRCALAMLENQDENVGRVLRKLDELGLSENTIVIYFSDNGPNSRRWNGGMKGIKGSVDEGGLRSPLLIRWPGKIKPGTRVREIASAIDLLPTVTHLAGVPSVSSKPLDGRDLSPLLTAQGAAGPDRMIFSAWNDQVSVRTQQHRLDAQGQLYDIVADPGQTTAINQQKPELARHLIEAVKTWRAEVLDSAPKLAYNELDPRPLGVGYPEFPITMLPARDGEPQGAVKRSSSAPNSSYFVNWRQLDDRLVWEINVQTAGRYAVTIDYTCPIEDAGSTIELSHRGRRLAGNVSPGWDPPLYSNQDTIPRPPAESQMKEFRSLALGEIDLTAGAGPLTLRALKIPGKSVMDLRRVTLTLLPSR